MDPTITCTIKTPEDANASHAVAIAENPMNNTTPASARMMWAKKTHTKFWAPGRTLRIAFLSGSEEFKSGVKTVASNWLPHINLKFDFVEGIEGDIRIDSDSGNCWSYIGTDALLYEEGPTMSLSPDLFHAKYFAANVLHEFGHLLGAEHEQVHPMASIPWDKKAFYEYHGLSEHPNEEEDDYQTVVKRQRVDSWYLDRLNPDETHHSPYDRKSIMHYEIRQQWTEGNFQIFLNHDLSEQDKAFMAKAYPFSHAQTDE
jgi:hypothetical protein